MKFRFTLALFAASAVCSVAAAQNEDAQVDPAPSGNEQAVIVTDGQTQMILPGENTPVEVDGNTLTFEAPEPETAPDDTTVIYEPSSDDVDIPSSD